MTAVEDILQLARWAPSGDNTQPWRFEIKGELEVVVHGFDTRAHCVYDLDGRPSQMALGALLETMRIAAADHGLRTEVKRRLEQPEEKPVFEVRFRPDAHVPRSPLLPYVTVRTVQRRPLSTRPLTSQQKSLLEASVGREYEVIWFETPRERRRVAMLMFLNGKLRLTMPEAFEVHREVIEWNAEFSEDKIPDAALGVDPLTRKLMRWVMRSWARVEFFNTWLAGTFVPRVQLDLVPGLACAAHFALVPKATPLGIDDYVAAGQAMQRFWLEATRLGLLLQPEMTPLIFARYQREHVPFTSRASAQVLGEKVAASFQALLGADKARRCVFFARIGKGNAPRARSTRIPLSRLIVGAANDSAGSGASRVARMENQRSLASDATGSAGSSMSTGSY